MSITSVNTAAGKFLEVPVVGVADCDAAQARQACGSEVGQ